MKKLFIGFLCALGILSLTACGGDGNKKPTTRKTKVTYCGWDLGTESEPTLKSKLIDKFNSEHETIIIEAIRHQGSYDAYLSTMASDQSLPDVFLVNSVPTAVISKLAKDITELTAADEEWKDVESSLKEAITFNNKVFAIPSAQNYMGFMANYDLIDEYAPAGSEEAEKKFAPGAFTTKEFFDTAKITKDATPTDGTGIIGINATGDMINWLPSTLDTTGKTKHYVWNAEDKKFDFTNQVMIDALSAIQELGNKNSKFTFNSYKGGEQENEACKTIFGTTDENTLFESGQMAFLQAATYYSFNIDEEDMNYKFIAYPDARVVSAADFLCISRSASNPEAAFEVAKYLSYGQAGLTACYELAETGEVKLTGLPITTNKTLTDKWFDYVTLPGVKEVYEKVVSGDIEVMVEGNKSVPGFKNARFDFQTGISIEGVRNGDPLTIGDFIWDVCEGSISINDYTTKMTKELADKINEEIVKAYDEISKLA